MDPRLLGLVLQLSLLSRGLVVLIITIVVVFVVFVVLVVNLVACTLDAPERRRFVVVVVRDVDEKQSRVLPREKGLGRSPHADGVLGEGLARGYFHQKPLSYESIQVGDCHEGGDVPFGQSLHGISDVTRHG
jgi:hypothetical protein